MTACNIQKTMELSANWKKLKATLNVEATRKTSAQQANYDRKILKRKRPAAPVSRPEKKPNIGRSSMDGDVAKERINKGLSERYVILLSRMCARLNWFQRRHWQICCA